VSSAELEAKVVAEVPGIATAKLTCCASPVQVEGRLDDGRGYYFRARYRGCKLEIFPARYADVIAAWEADDVDVTHGWQDPDAMEFVFGSLEELETVAWMKFLLGQGPQPPTPSYG